jgi:neutral ceramidase
VAEDVARKVYEAIGKLQFGDQVTLTARYREPLIACRRPTPEQLKWAKDTLAKAATPKKGADLPAIYAQRTLRLAEHPESIPIPLQVLRIGDVCIGSMPTEVFCEIGLEFRKRCPIQPAFLVSLAHGYYGYLPAFRHFELGGYETWLGSNRLEPHASEKMLDALHEMAAEIKNAPGR